MPTINETKLSTTLLEYANKMNKFFQNMFMYYNTWK